jgi:threonine dehydratase
MTGLVEVRAAADLLKGVADRTPVQLSRALSHVVGAEVWLKCENLQRAGSFKLRGAYVRMARLSEEEKARGVVAASAGNHAQGVALAARILGLTAVVFMPSDAALPKIAATREYGARVELVGSSVDEALVHAREFADRTGAVLIHPFDHDDVVAGQGTIALEIVEQVPDVATIVVPVGGGGLAAGVVAALAELRPDVRVIGVQAARAAAYPASLAAGHPVPAPELRTMADGIAVGTPGTVPFGILASHHIEVRTVSEEDLSRALLLVAERAKMLVEPSGAAAAAALMAGVGPIEGPVVAILSGGNIDPLVLMRVVRHGLASAGRFLQLQVRIDDTPGALADLLRALADTGGNVMHVSHARTVGDLQLDEVAIVVQVETKGPDHCDYVLQQLRDAGYRLTNH